MKFKILLLGSGELGKEFAIAAKRDGQTIIAVDSYAGAPAMQVADQFEVIDMLDAAALDMVVAKHQPNIIVPEIEAIRTERFYDYEAQGIQVVPSAKAANFTMNRKAIRDYVAKNEHPTIIGPIVVAPASSRSSLADRLADCSPGMMITFAGADRRLNG